MARQMKFKVGEAEYTAVPVKMDRLKLYGWSELMTVAADGKPAKLYESSFNTVNLLSAKVASRQLLDYSVTDFYRLSAATASNASNVKWISPTMKNNSTNYATAR